MSTSPSTMTAAAHLDERCITAAIRGMTPARIARDVTDGAYTAAQVRKVLHAAAERIRSESAALVAARWMRHDEILTRLIDTWYQRLLKDGFDKDVSTALIKALERQSRLHGIDPSNHALGSDEWLPDRSDQEHVELLRRHGFNLPDDILAPSRN
jgi:hypothetical protein